MIFLATLATLLGPFPQLESISREFWTELPLPLTVSQYCALRLSNLDSRTASGRRWCTTPGSSLQVRCPHHDIGLLCHEHSLSPVPHLLLPHISLSSLSAAHIPYISNDLIGNLGQWKHSHNLAWNTHVLSSRSRDKSACHGIGMWERLEWGRLKDAQAIDKKPWSTGHRQEVCGWKWGENGDLEWLRLQVVATTTKFVFGIKRIEEGGWWRWCVGRRCSWRCAFMEVPLTYGCCESFSLGSSSSCFWRFGYGGWDSR